MDALSLPLVDAFVVGVAAVTGQMVVYHGTTLVVTWPTGQLVTVEAHEVTV